MKKYVGTPKTFKVTVDGKPLNPRFDLRNHSPDGFCWGYLGSGPAQLSLAILADCLGADLALVSYQKFKEHYIGNIPREQGFEITEEQIQGMLREIGISMPWD